MLFILLHLGNHMWRFQSENPTGYRSPAPASHGSNFSKFTMNGIHKETKTTDKNMPQSNSTASKGHYPSEDVLNVEKLSNKTQAVAALSER